MGATGPKYGRDAPTGEFVLPNVISGTLMGVAGSVAGKTFPLTAGTCTIGRRNDCDVVVDDAGVSKIHARIIAKGDRYVLKDNGSRNGTLVNGAPAQTAKLKSGDEIRVCDSVFRITVVTPATAQGRPLSRRNRTLLNVLMGGTAFVITITILNILSPKNRSAEAPPAAPVAGTAPTPAPIPAQAAPSAVEDTAVADHPPVKKIDLTLDDSPTLEEVAPPQPPESIRSVVIGKVRGIAVIPGEFVAKGELVIELDNSVAMRRIEGIKVSIEALENMLSRQPSEHFEQVLAEERARLKRLDRILEAKRILAPMDGRVVEIQVQIGQSVEKGQQIGLIQPSETEKQPAEPAAELGTPTGLR